MRRTAVAPGGRLEDAFGPFRVHAIESFWFACFGEPGQVKDHVGALDAFGQRVDIVNAVIEVANR